MIPKLNVGGSIPPPGRSNLGVAPQDLVTAPLGDIAKFRFLAYGARGYPPYLTNACRRLMNNVVVLMILAFSSLLEAGGDALVRVGLHTQGLPQRVAIIVLGGLVLTAYGVVVNTPHWDFGRLLGVYVSLFFLASQVINAVVFRVAPSLPILVGGAMIIGGGLLITFWRAGGA